VIALADPKLGLLPGFGQRSRASYFYLDREAR
jgi:hypothetical protein